MFFLWFSRSWSPYWSFSSFSGAGQTNNAEGSFFLTFRSNREIFFVVHFFSVKGVGGGMKGILLIIFVFLRENTISFQLFFKLITDVRSHIGLVWHFARFFLDLDFFLFRRWFFFRSRIFFCLRFSFFFIFFVKALDAETATYVFTRFFSRARDDDEVAYLVYVVRNDEVGWQQNKNNLFNHLLPPLPRPHHLPLLKIRIVII